MKVYIEMDSMQFELMRFRKKYQLCSLAFAKRGVQYDRRVYAWKVVSTCLFESNDFNLHFNRLRLCGPYNTSHVFVIKIVYK